MNIYPSSKSFYEKIKKSGHPTKIKSSSGTLNILLLTHQKISHADFLKENNFMKFDTFDSFRKINFPSQKPMKSFKTFIRVFSTVQKGKKLQL